MRNLLKTILVVYNWNGFDPRQESRLKKLLRLITLATPISLLVQNVLEIVLNWEGVATIAKVYFFPLLVNFFMIVLTILTKQSTFLDILHDLELLWKPKSRKCQQMVDTIHRRVSKFVYSYFAYCALCGLQMIFLPVLQGRREIIYGGYDFCNIQNDLCYTMIFLWQLSVTYLHLYTTLFPTEWLYMYLIAEIYCSIEVLKDVIVEGSATLLPIGEIVRQHDVILRLVRHVDTFFSTMLLIQYLNSFFGMVFCLYVVKFQGLPTLDTMILVNFSGLYLVLLMELFFYSYGGYIIKEQTESIAFTIYSTDWYAKLEPARRRKLWFIMQRAHMYERLTVGGMADLDLVSYVTVVRGSYSVMALISTMENR